MTAVLIILASAAAVSVAFLVWHLTKNKKKGDTPAVSDVQASSTPVGDNNPTPPQEPPQEQVKEGAYDTVFEGFLDCFSVTAEVERDTKTYDHLHMLFRETYSQFNDRKSLFGIAVVHKKENFPTLYQFGSIGDQKRGLDTIVGWVLALQLAELMPRKRTDILKIGYELGGYTRYDNIYGYDFNSDPNLLRMSAGIIYAAMRGKMNPDIDAMRKEMGGAKYDEPLATLANGKRDAVSPNDFFTDFREFMPTAPAPYAPGYTDRPDRTYPSEERDDFDNLETDRMIHEMIVDTYNLKPNEHYQECVQAIADKEADAGHMFGGNRQTKHYHFHPIFGKDTIGMEFSPDSTLSMLAQAAFNASSSSRGILQSASVSPKQYGRLRPGCSWKQEGCKNSSSDDSRNVLVDFEIEDGDGSPTGYYDENGNWVYMNGIHNPDEFNEKSKSQLYANSYPSGHSAGIIGSAMVLAELYPDKADVILRAANQFAVNRTIARYHWTSDTINGRVLGTATNAVAHASSDYDDMLAKARKELSHV